MTDVITSAANGLAHITLNRPQALHALTTHMCANMIQALLAWREDESIRAVVLDHAPGTRGFCAGGDIRMIAESGAGNGEEARRFFHTEYQLNHLLFHYPKPVIALIDGVTMGGGVGISMPARFRIATENTTYAMPETGIGLFPDVGGGWYLPRKPGQIGMWLALTGARLKAADCLIAGIATHYVEAAKLDALKQALLEPPPPRGAGAGGGGRAEHGVDGAVALDPDRPPSQPSPARGEGFLAQTLAQFASPAGAPKELTPENVERINRIFALGSVEEIFAALEKDASDWAMAQLATLRTKSPQTLKVTFRQLREGARMVSFGDEMRQEYRIACRVSAMHDFQEGVRAVVIDKDNKPAWNPATLEGVTDALVDSIFAPMPAGEEWSPLVAN
jgi:enoyl-CoA hydratase